MPFNSLKKIIIVLVFISLLGLLANNVVNGHFHHLNSGQVIFHAHPYGTDGAEQPVQPSHEHSNSQFLFFDLYTALVFVFAFFVLVVLFALPRLNSILFIPEISFVLFLFSSTLQRRGPPACL